MDKFKELSLEEKMDLDGGFILMGGVWYTPNITDFAIGFVENLGPAFERAAKKIKYERR
ncbi:MAG: hypothetical protein ACXIUD_02105 [Mongoliitalea sp.]